MANEELDRKLGIREVMRIENVSRSTLYARIERGLFPKPILNETGRTKNEWWESDIRRHQQAERVRLAELEKKRQSKHPFARPEPA